MFTGKWDIDIKYEKGHIVYIHTLNKYYICIKRHTSNNLSFPSKEDLYWINICNTFVNNNNNINTSKSNSTNYLNYTNSTENKKNVNKNKRKLYINTLIENLDNLDNIDNVDTFDNIDNNKPKKILSLRKRLENIEMDLEEHRKKKFICENIENLRESLLLMNVDMDTKVFIMDKYESTRNMSNSDYSKTINWLKTVNKIPFGKNKDFAIKKDDTQENIKKFFETVKAKLDNTIYGLEEVKQEILEFVAKKITNPNSKGHVLALYGNAGVGKTKIIRTLAEALNLPFYQINFGGLNDVSVLTGHSETYIGAKPGKIVEVLASCKYMNPVLYLDECDKVSENKATEIFGVLTHLLDEEQNHQFQDNYLSNINIDLSKVFFVLAFNDISKIDSIVSDRLKIIYIDPPSLQDKVVICQDKMIPDILKTIKLKDDLNVIFTKEIIEYIILKKTVNESGVRQLRKNIEKILNRLNYDLLVNNLTHIKTEINSEKSQPSIYITQTYINNVLKAKDDDANSYSHMYI